MPDTQIYGLDIETDTRHGSIDPKDSSIITVALAGPAFDEVFCGDEATLLAALDVRLLSLAPGVIATWNGAIFDLPFIADRARRHGIDLGLRLHPDPQRSSVPLRLPGHAGPYRAGWHHHRHLDTVRVLGEPGARTSPVRSLLRALGLGGSTATGPRRDLLHEAVHAHPPSDARLARVLATRHWASAVRRVDLLPAGPEPAAEGTVVGSAPVPASGAPRTQPAIAGL